MFALSQPPEPPPPEIYRGHVIQIIYRTTPEGRLHTFDPDNPVHDLQFREWTTNAFSTQESGAEEINARHISYGFESRILPGVAERQKNGEFEFFVEH